jgi:kynurenine formamidase
MTRRLPTFAELEARDDGSPAGTSWGVFGDDDEIGTLNLLDAPRVLAGAQQVVLGEVHSLNWRVDRPCKNVYRRTPQRVHLGAGNDFGRDDYIDRFFLQYSSQWDGLRHIVLDNVFYNGVSPDVVDDVDSGTLGIHLWAERGIAGRGVLLDVGRYLLERGEPIDYRSSSTIGVDVLDAAAAVQGVQIEPGDILLVRTGWCGWYETLAPHEQAELFVGDAPQPGLMPGRASAAWLWDHHIAAVAADNVAFEAHPIDASRRDSLHRSLIPGFGMPIGEYFWLDGLADACARDDRWTFLFTSAPLNVHGGVGSPPNALALR